MKNNKISEIIEVNEIINPDIEGLNIKEDQ